MRMWVQPLPSLSELRIWHYHELGCRSQAQLRSCVAVAVAMAGSCSSDKPLAWEFPYATGHRCRSKKQKKKKKKKKKKKERKKDRERDLLVRCSHHRLYSILLLFLTTSTGFLPTCALKLPGHSRIYPEDSCTILAISSPETLYHVPDPSPYNCLPPSLSSSPPSLPHLYSR